MMMEITAGAVFSALEGVLTAWILFRERNLERKPAWFKIFLLGTCSLLAFAAGWRAAGGADPFRAAGLGVALLGVTASMLADWERYVIPNRYLLYMCAGRGIIFAAELLFRREELSRSMMDSLVGCAASLVLMLILFLMAGGGLGMGDVKLMAVVGLLAGARTAFSCLIHGILVCGACSLVLLMLKRRRLKDELPLGPFLYVGYVITLLGGVF